MEQLKAPLERRRGPRESISLQAIVKFPGGPGMPCKIQNVSPNGALLAFDEPTILPSSFTLIIPEKWFQSDCVVRHKSPHYYGVTFVTNRKEPSSRFS